MYDTGIGVLGTVLHDPASRVEAVKVGATIVSRYYYHGQGIVTWTNLMEPGISAQAGTSAGYPNWDNFNRPISTKWTKYVPGATDFFDLDINWDKSGSIVGVVDNIRLTGIGGARNFDTQYSNDNLGRLLRARQGALSGTTLSSATRDEQWTDGTNSKLSQTGNWLYRRLDLNGNGMYCLESALERCGQATLQQPCRTFILGHLRGVCATLRACEAGGEACWQAKSICSTVP